MLTSYNHRLGTKIEAFRYRFATFQAIDLNSALALESFPSAAPFLMQTSTTRVQFTNIGNLTVGIDVPELGIKLDMIPGGSETRLLSNIDPHKTYSLEFSFRDSDHVHVVTKRYETRFIAWNSTLISD